MDDRLLKQTLRSFASSIAALVLLLGGAASCGGSGGTPGIDSGGSSNAVAYGDCRGKPRRQDSDPLA